MEYVLTDEDLSLLKRICSDYLGGRLTAQTQLPIQRRPPLPTYVGITDQTIPAYQLLSGSGYPGSGFVDVYGLQDSGFMSGEGVTFTAYNLGSEVEEGTNVGLIRDPYSGAYFVVPVPQPSTFVNFNVLQGNFTVTADIDHSPFITTGLEITVPTTGAYMVYVTGAATIQGNAGDQILLQIGVTGDNMINGTYFGSQLAIQAQSTGVEQTGPFCLSTFVGATGYDSGSGGTIYLGAAVTGTETMASLLSYPGGGNGLITQMIVVQIA